MSTVDPELALAAAAEVIEVAPGAPAEPVAFRGLAGWVRPYWRPMVIYALSRALVLLTMGVVALVNGGTLGGRIDRWDSRWYLRVVAGGYPSQLPVSHGHVLASTVAFFPGFPLAIRGVAGLTGMSFFAAGVAVSSFTGLTATIGVWLLVREYAGEQAADRATVLFACFVGSFVFSMIYSEGLVITAVAFGLLALLRCRWLAAGLLGLVATATAPIGLAFVLSAGLASVRAVRDRREWWSLAAPVLAPLGTALYLLWTWIHTGNVAAFTQTERGGWHSYLSITYPFKVLWANLAHPVATTANPRLVGFCIVGVVVATVIAIRDRQPALLALYGIAAAVLATVTQPVGPRPRLILDAFPLILAVALRYRKGWRYGVAVTTSIVLLVAMTAYTVGVWVAFP
jgi:hypothetical protein